MTMERFPQQKDVDFSDMESALVWTLAQIPFSDRVTMPIQLNVAKCIARHQNQLGVVHVDYLKTLADENGYIHVDQLPKQQKKLRMPHRGQQHHLNGSATWVGMDAPEADPVVLPDVEAMTVHERKWLVEELKNVGAIQDPPPDRGKLAQVTSFKHVRESKNIRKASDLLGGNRNGAST